MFSWDSVPGDDDEKLKEFLRGDFDIDWAENAEILKSDDGKTIRIVKDEKSVEIKIDEKKEKATLKNTDGRTHELKVKRENGKLNIYEGCYTLYTQSLSFYTKKKAIDTHDVFSCTPEKALL